MKLTDAQLKQFDEQGYIFVPELFSAAEVKVLTDQVPGLYAQRRQEVVREKDGGSRTIKSNRRPRFRARLKYSIASPQTN